jgi:DNA (cytosine-5)-methyltransferase 1
MTDKPKYPIPSMKEIKKVKQNGYRVISTFSGCGGTCLGFKRAGFKIIWCNEFIPEAREVYKLNHPEVFINPDDIRTLTPEKILKEAKIKKGEIDVLEGSPPCVAFSASRNSFGRHDINWKKTVKYSSTEQRIDDLFWEFIRILDGLQPKVFIAENVEGIIKGVGKGYFKRIMLDMTKCGYIVEARVLNSKFLGVPQNRPRLIFMGTRSDLGVNPVYPTPLSYMYSVSDVCPGIISYSASGFMGNWKSAKYPYGTVVQGGGRLSKTAYLSCNGYVREEYMKHGMLMIRERKLTISELKLICGFPDDFILTGTFNQQWERLGRAVSPPVSYEIAKVIKERILDAG